MGGLALAGVLLLAGLLGALFGASAWGILGVALAFFMWGSLMAAVGATGLYVARTYKEARGRPRWIVADAIGIEARPDRATAVELS